MSVRDLHADVEYLEGEINRLSREIHDSLRVTNSPGRGRRPRPGMSTSTPYVRRRDSVSGYVSGDVCMCDDEDPVPSDRPPVQNNANPRTSNTNPGPVRSRNFVKPATYDGSGLWNDYLSHFESVCLLNDWTETEKGLYLAASLRGLAQGVLGNQPRDERQNYRKLVKALQDRFAPMNQTELYRAQLRERRQKASESLPEMGQDIRRLVNLAYPTAPDDVREILATEQFLDGLHNSEMRLKIKQARPINLNDAIQRAVELEAYYRAENRHTDAVRTMSENTEDSSKASKLDNFIETVEKNMRSLQRDMRDLKQWKFQSQSQRRMPRPETHARDSNRTRKCYKCGSDKHLRKDCPQLNKGSDDKLTQVNSTRETNPKTDTSFQKNQCSSDQYSRVVHSINEKGVYVTARIHGMDAYLLVDTGATVSLLSTICYENIKRDANHALTEVERDVLSATGSVLRVLGRTPVDFTLNGIALQQEMIVADLTVDGILGLDFLVRHEAVINMRMHQISISGIEHPIQLEGSASYYKVAIIHRVTVPPRSELVVEGQIRASSDGGLPTKAGLIEPSEKFQNSCMLAKTLVRRQDTIPLRIMNISDDSKTIYPGTVVGKLHAVDEVLSLVSEGNRDLDVDRELPAHLQELFISSTSHIDKDDVMKAKALLLKYAALFSETDEDVGRTAKVRHKIETGVNAPIKQAPRRLPFHMQEEVQNHVSDMLRRGIIEPSQSPWSAAIVLVKKKDGSTRFCVDYRRLNSITTKDAYPLPRIDESLHQLRGAKWFSTLDLNAGYWQVELDPEDKKKTAFVTRQGLYEFNVMPFGLCNAPATFERLMETVLAGLQWQICLIYLDDIIVYGKTFDDMLQNLELVFEKLLAAGLKLKARKCSLFARQVKYLGHIISEQGIETDPEKVEIVKHWPEPVNKTQVRSFIGLSSYYRKFIPNFARIAQPLHKLTEASVPFKWTDECQDAFQLLKDRLISAPILTHPDFTKPFILDTDASQYAMGAALSQLQDGQERVVAYASKVLSKSEKKYCVTRKELLAVVTFIKHFRPFLYGHKFLVRTDHSSLKWLLRFKDPEGQLARWIEVISTYDMEIEHRAGKLHGNADGLSRVPCGQCGYFDDWDKSEVSEGHVRIIEDKIRENSESDLATLQDECRDIRLVKSWLQDKTRPEYSDISSESYVVKSLWAQWSRLTLKDNFLCRVWEVEDSNMTTYQIVVPLSQRRYILQQMHDAKTSAHLGMTKTLNKIRQNYYWPGLQSDVRSYISGCDVCSRRKAPLKTKRAPMQPLQVGYPLERIATDILGEFPETENGNRYIIVISDYFTKWTEAFPMRNMEAQTVAKIVTNEVICRLGCPATIHSDQGRQYESILFTEVCKLLQIRKTRTTPYHPQSDGMVERFNKTLATMLSAYVDENHRDWDESIPFVMMAYRASQHESTGYSPNMLMLGREVATPLDIMYDMPSSWKEVPRSEWVWIMQDRMERAHAFVRRHAEGAMFRQKHYHDMKMSYEKFKEGENVYVYFPQRKVGCSPKFTSYWRGPFKILTKLSEVLYKVNCGRNGKDQVIHCDRLKTCKAQILKGENELQTPLESSTESQLDVQFESEVIDERQSKVEVTDELAGEFESKRNRRAPVWMRDYVTE